MGEYTRRDLLRAGALATGFVLLHSEVSAQTAQRAPRRRTTQPQHIGNGWYSNYPDDFRFGGNSLRYLLEDASSGYAYREIETPRGLVELRFLLLPERTQWCANVTGGIVERNQRALARNAVYFNLSREDVGDPRNSLNTIYLTVKNQDGTAKSVHSERKVDLRDGRPYGIIVRYNPFISTGTLEVLDFSLPMFRRKILTADEMQVVNGPLNLNEMGEIILSDAWDFGCPGAQATGYVDELFYLNQGKEHQILPAK